MKKFIVSSTVKSFASEQPFTAVVEFAVRADDAEQAIAGVKALLGELGPSERKYKAEAAE